MIRNHDSIKKDGPTAILFIFSIRMNYQSSNFLKRCKYRSKIKVE